MRASRSFLLLFLLAWGSAELLAANLVVVVNARSGIERLSHAEVVNIFMGRYRVLPSGIEAQPIDQPAPLPERSLFYRKLVGKELAEINAYWARLVFSGKTTPPRQASRTSEVVEWVASHDGGVAYLDRDRLDDRVKVVLELP